jgi:hypothetical protein
VFVQKVEKSPADPFRLNEGAFLGLVSLAAGPADGPDSVPPHNMTTFDLQTKHAEGADDDKIRLGVVLSTMARDSERMEAEAMLQILCVSDELEHSAFRRWRTVRQLVREHLRHRFTTGCDAPVPARSPLSHPISLIRSIGTS